MATKGEWTMTALPNFDKVFITRPGSIGEYVYGDCPTCKAGGRECIHTILICRNCGAPPVASGCICDAAIKWDRN